MDAYDGSIAYIDAEIGQLMADLDERGLLDRTLVVITSDHGEEFNEHGLIHHGNSLYRPAVQVPLLLVGPSRIPAGLSVSPPISLRDVPATVIDLADIAGGQAFPGHSLARFWQGTTLPDDTLLTELKYAPLQPDWYPASKGDMVSAVSRGLRYLRSGDGREELYDFERDPSEQSDLSTRNEYASDLDRFRALTRDVSRPAPVKPR
jgi:arylsulfatase A-like enzyme